MPSFLADAHALVRDFFAFGGRRLWATIALILVGGLLEGVGLALLLPIFSLLTPEAGGRWHSLAAHAFAMLGLGGRTAQLGAVLLGFCLIVVVRALVLSTRDRMLSDLSLGFVDQQRQAVVADLAHARWASLARLRHSRIAHILSSEIARLALACSILMQMVVSLVMLAVQAVLIAILSLLMGVVVIAILLLGLVTIMPLSRRAASLGRSSARFAFGIAGEASHFLGGLKSAIAHDLTGAFVAQIGAESARLRAMQDGQRRLQSHVSIASTSVAALAGAAFLFVGVGLAVPTVTLLAALVVLARMSGPIRLLQANVQQLFGVLPAFTALRDLYRDLGAPIPPPLPGLETPLAAWRTIRFADVGFRYPDARAAVFEHLDVRIDAGEMVGIAGPSGAGKTTFVDLLAGLLEPGTGAILIGETPLAGGTVAQWRRRLAYVAQESYLLNDSLRRNLSWGLPARPDEALWRRLAEAGAADIATAMPDGLDTILDERGSRLSGGERQRIALARALLRDPDLLILDEATNAIDVATERGVIANIRRALPAATILIVAHRAETLQACDRIVSLAPDAPVPTRAAADQTNRPTSASAGSTG